MRARSGQHRGNSARGGEKEGEVRSRILEHRLDRGKKGGGETPLNKSRVARVLPTIQRERKEEKRKDRPSRQSCPCRKFVTPSKLPSTPNPNTELDQEKKGGKGGADLRTAAHNWAIQLTFLTEDRPERKKKRKKVWFFLVTISLRFLPSFLPREKKREAEELRCAFFSIRQNRYRSSTEKKKRKKKKKKKEGSRLVSCPARRV